MEIQQSGPQDPVPLTVPSTIGDGLLRPISQHRVRHHRQSSDREHGLTSPSRRVHPQQPLSDIELRRRELARRAMVKDPNRLTNHARHKKTLDDKTPRSVFDWAIEPRMRDHQFLSSFPQLAIGDESSTLWVHLRPWIETLYHREAEIVAVNPSITQMVDTRLFSDKTFCWAMAAYAWVRRVRPNGIMTDTPETRQLHRTSLALFSQEVSSLNSSDPARNATLLVILIALIHTDVAFMRRDYINAHWSGLVQLVQVRGGLEQLGGEASIVLIYEANCAIVLGKPPMFTDGIDRRTEVEYPTSGLYGSAIETLQQQTPQLYAQEVIEFVQDAVHLTELWEIHKPLHKDESYPAYHPARPSSEYFFLERLRLHRRFAVLQAMLTRIPYRSKCMLWASRICEYAITWENYQPALPTVLCNELVTTLKSQVNKSLEIWSASFDVLSWVLFALAVSEMKFNGRNWVIETLRNLLKFKYPAESYIDIIQKERTVVEGFVWSQYFLGQQLDNVFTELFS